MTAPQSPQIVQNRPARYTARPLHVSPLTVALFYWRSSAQRAANRLIGRVLLLLRPQSLEG
jgi:hypothetical protein